MDKNLIRELRQMFLDGATPSRLMSHIAEHHGDARLHFIIKDYFHEAFGVPLLRNVTANEDHSPDRRHAHFNRNVVPEMVESVEQWHPETLAETWLEGHTVVPLANHIQRLKTFVPDGLARVWDTLTDEERLTITRTFARKNRDWQIIKCLASLAERLQEKVAELEGRLQNGQAISHDAEAAN